MNEDNTNNNSNIPNASENDFGKELIVSESFGNIPKESSESFGSFPNHSENNFGNVPKLSERTEHHTLTVREVAKLFDEANVPRTERSIINWCNPNRQGMPRLDCYFDPNDRKYFITPQSVHRVISEEVNRARSNGKLPNVSETHQNISEAFGNVPKESSETFGSFRKPSETSFGNVPKEPDIPKEIPHEKPRVENIDSEKDRRLKELEQENLDLKIMNKGKDYFVEELKNDRERFAKEREHLIDQLVTSTRQIGVLETKLLQLEAPRHTGGRERTTNEHTRDSYRFEEEGSQTHPLRHEPERVFDVTESYRDQKDNG